MASKLRAITQVAAAWLVCISVVLSDGAPQQAAPRLETVTATMGSKEQQLTGRMLATDAAGTHLFEEHNGCLHQIADAAIRSREPREEAFRYPSADELSAALVQQLGGGFQITQTERFVVCSNGSSQYAKFVADLLEKVADDYFAFWKDSEVSVTEPVMPLPVIVFRTSDEYSDFARQQHPENEFANVGGYYSVRFNQMLLPEQLPAGATGSRRDLLRQLRTQTRKVETVVHEAVHQLAFNTGLQIRYADNPLWLTEGLAVYFEGVANRGTLLWTGPGRTSNVHLPHFRQAAEGGTLSLPLRELIASNEPFQQADQRRAAYAKAWALTFTLIRRDRKAFDRLATTLQNRKRVVKVSAEQQQQEFEDAVQRPVGEVESDLIRYMSRIRLPR